MDKKQMQTEQYRKNLGHKIKLLREIHGMTQIELAERLGYVSTGTISQIEKGERGMKREKLLLVSKILNISQEILTSSTPMSPEDLKISAIFFKFMVMPANKRPEDFKKITQMLLATYNKNK